MAVQTRGCGPRAARRVARHASSTLCATAPGHAARVPQPRSVCPGCGADVPAHPSTRALAHGWGGPAAGRCARAGGAQAPAGERNTHAGPRARTAIFHTSVPRAVLQRALAAVEHARRCLGHRQGLQAGADGRRLLVGEVDRREECAQPAGLRERSVPALRHVGESALASLLPVPRPTPILPQCGRPYTCLIPLQRVPGGQDLAGARNRRSGAERVRPADPPSPAHHVQATSELVRQLLTHVRTAHPHFNESNGADHVMVFSYDHARCDLAPALRLAEWGQLLSIQSYGDLTYTCARPPTRGARLAAWWCTMPVPVRERRACRLRASRGSGTPLVPVSAGPMMIKQESGADLGQTAGRAPAQQPNSTQTRPAHHGPGCGRGQRHASARSPKQCALSPAP